MGGEIEMNIRNEHGRVPPPSQSDEGPDGAGVSQTGAGARWRQGSDRSRDQMGGPDRGEGLAR